MMTYAPAIPASAPLVAGGLPALASRALAGAVSLTPLRKRLSILIFHRVLAEPDPIFPSEMDARRFEQRMIYLKNCFSLVSLEDGIRGLRDGSLPPRAACITFDDGYADNAEIALPILQRQGVHATFFIATGFLDGGRMWNDTVIELIRRAPAVLDLEPLGLGRHELDNFADRRATIGSILDALKYLPIAERSARVDALAAHIGVALPDNLMMRSEQVRQLHDAGMTVGGHTVNHPIVARMDAASARQEMADGKARLETLIGAPVTLFAYPNGKPGQDYLAEHAQIARELGFDAAVSTSWGAASKHSDFFQLPRFTPWDESQFKFSLRMMRNLANPGHTV